LPLKKLRQRHDVGHQLRGNVFGDRTRVFVSGRSPVISEERWGCITGIAVGSIKSHTRVRRSLSMFGDLTSLMTIAAEIIV